MVERPPPQSSLTSLNPLQQCSAELCMNATRSPEEVRRRLVVTCQLALKCQAKTLKAHVSLLT